MKVALIYDHESELYYTHLYTNAIIQYNLVFVLFFFLWKTRPMKTNVP